MQNLTWSKGDLERLKEDDREFRLAYESAVSTLEETGRAVIRLESEERTWKKFAGSEQEFYDLVMKHAEKYVFMEVLTRCELEDRFNAGLCAVSCHESEDESETCSRCDIIDAFTLYFNAGGVKVGKTFTSNLYDFLVERALSEDVGVGEDEGKGERLH
jgi:hypothetical protein